jgi:hypothetical protein
MKRSGFPKHVTAYWRAGKKYVRARRHGVTYYFTSLPGTDEFALEYQRWLAGEARTEGVGASTTKPGSVSALIAKYYRSAEWANLSASTQVTYRGILERFRTDHGDKPVKLLERRHVCDMHAARANTPAAANNLVRMIRILMQFAINEEWRKDDPTVGIKMLKVKGDGFHSWTDDEIAAFEARWSIGTRERLALGVLLYTGQRRGDVVHMGRQHVTGYKIAVLQEKTKTRLVIPLHPELRKRSSTPRRPAPSTSYARLRASPSRRRASAIGSAMLAMQRVFMAAPPTVFARPLVGVSPRPDARRTRSQRSLVTRR